MKTNAGIYKITNVINNKIYVGSSINLKSRKHQHFYRLEKQYHGNNHLQSAYNKYGKDNFKWEIIEYLPLTEDKEENKKLILEREQYWIDTLDVCNTGYNINKNAEWNFCTEETKRKISEGNKGKIVTDEFRIKMSNIIKGRKLSEKNKERLKKLHTGNKYRLGIKHTEESKKKMSSSLKGKVSPNKGKPMSEEQKVKIRNSKKGSIPWNLGKPMSEEQKIKVSNSKKGVPLKITPKDQEEFILQEYGNTKNIRGTLREYNKKFNMNYKNPYIIYKVLKKAKIL